MKGLWNALPPFDPANAALTGGNAFFVPSGGVSFAPVSCPADTSEDTLAAITIPPISAKGGIRITTHWTATNGANNKTPRIRFSGASGTVYFTATITTQTTWQIVTEIFNQNATNSQRGGTRGETGSGTNLFLADVTSAVDTTASTSVVITGQKATGTDTLTLDGYLVEVINP